MTTEVQPNLKPDTLPIHRTWANPDAARMWLKRHPQTPALTVIFDQSRAVFCLTAVDADVEQNDVPAPEFAQEPSDMPRKSIPGVKHAKAVRQAAAKASKAPKLAGAAKAAKAAREAAPRPDMPADPTGGVLVRDCLITIAGLPGDSTAYTWAMDLARKLRLPIIVTAMAREIGTIDADHLAAVKAATTKPRTTSGGEPREAKTAPEGKRLEVVHLCMRENGASTKELIAATGWQGCPWKWTIGSNKNGTGLADKFGYGFRSEKIDGEVRYYLTPATSQEEEQAAA